MIYGTEWIILGIVVLLLLFGAQKLPELARAIGRALGEFERGKQEIERELEEAKRTPVMSPAKPQSKVEREKLVKAAKELGIKVEGKSDEELRAEINKAVS